MSFILKSTSMALKNGLTIMNSQLNNSSKILSKICHTLNVSYRQENISRCSNNDTCRESIQGNKLCSRISTFLKRSKQYLVERPSLLSYESCPICQSYPKTFQLRPPYSKHLPSFPSGPCFESHTSFQNIKTKHLKNVYHLKLRPVQSQMYQLRNLHNSRRLLDKSNSGKDCELISEICKSKEEHCLSKTTCKDKDDKCYPEKVKCEPIKRTIKEKKEDIPCPTSCIRGEKCIITHSKKPPKMVYGSVECPPPKLIKSKTCPTMVDPKHDEHVYTGKQSIFNKPKKEVCEPPPLPGPPTEPVSLCPCPPPPKIHPGPCPCPIQKDHISIKPNPPCAIKDKYPCCIQTYYCPPKKPCERKSTCEKKPTCDENKNKS
ncbi:hypothetical protein M0802_000997 [Mischocyttarus mexicanus]|nr:hypothetical protein M0802_000997 [Mischocyttarus mexicanus]